MTTADFQKAVLDAALSYASRGWPVFPCRERGKTPLTAHGLRDATTDPAQIRAWWKQFPRANVAIVTGAAAGVWVLDVDLDQTKGVDGAPALAALQADHGSLPATLVQDTPRGGRHLVFRHPGAGVRVKTVSNRPAAGLDVRGDGGYIVAAPSIHPNGRSYAWLSDLAPAEPPAWLIELVREKPKERRAPTASSPAPAASSATSSAPAGYVAAAVEAERKRVATAGAGGRNEALNGAAYNLGQLVAGGELGADHVEAVLYGAAVASGLVADDGEEAVRKTLASGLAAGAQRPRKAPERASRGKRPPRTRNASAALPAAAGEVPARPSIDADEGDLARLGDAAWDALAVSNDPPWLFRFGDAPVRVERADHGSPRLVGMTVDRLRYELARRANWHRVSKDGEVLPAAPPVDAARDILARPDLPLPVLRGVVTAPVFGASGALQTSPGYHPESRVLYAPAPGFSVPAVPARPSDRQLAAARSMIVEELLGDFPFTSAAELANAVALLLLPFCRPMIDGATPLHLIEKPAAGTGATLMVDVIATVAAGHGAALMLEAREDEEWRKRITSTLRDTPSMVLIDNLRRTLDSSALAAAITAPVWGDRVLGASENVHVPVRCVWIATGNNPQVSNEIARRIVRIRLDAQSDQPWRRQGFRHPDLLAFARSRRAELVWSCLVLVQAWLAAGRPAPERPVMLGMFEGWAGTLGGILEHAGVPGFLSNLDEFHAASDGEAAAWRAFVGVWWSRHGEASVGTAELYAIAAELDLPLGLGDGSERSQRTRLGLRLGSMRDRRFMVETGAGVEFGLQLCRGRSVAGAGGVARYQLAPCGP